MHKDFRYRIRNGLKRSPDAYRMVAGAACLNRGAREGRRGGV